VRHRKQERKAEDRYADGDCGDGQQDLHRSYLMIDKISGKVAYVVLTFGWFMGFGEDFYPIPWSTLEYDTNLGGYRLDVTKEQLKNAPKYTESTGWNWNRQNDETLHSYYMAPAILEPVDLTLIEQRGHVRRN
jgi:PRC-barrel domain